MYQEEGDHWEDEYLNPVTLSIKAKDKSLEQPGMVAGLEWQKVSIPLDDGSCDASGSPNTVTVVEATCILLIWRGWESLW